MKNYIIFSTVIVSVLICSSTASKILFLCPMPAHSHFTVCFRLAKELADRGHEVTNVNPYPQKTPIKNYRDIPVTETFEAIKAAQELFFQNENAGMLSGLTTVFELGYNITKAAVSSPNFQNLIKSSEHFDVVITELFVDEALLGVAKRFKAPSIILSSLPATFFSNYLVANPAPSAYIPNMGSGLTQHMTFGERVQNLFINLVSEICRDIWHLPQQSELYDRFIKTDDVELYDLMFNASLILLNSHPSINDATPLVSSMIEIGGFHMSPPKKLPDDIQKFLDDATEGVVLFSMGSNLKSKDLEPEVREGILRAFSKIKQKVLWKFEADLPNAPENVKIMSWLPQADVLAHPNVKAFISHGGLLGSIEALSYGVPVIGIPVFGDQKNNIMAAVRRGYAVMVPLPELNEVKLSWALNEVLNKPHYRNNVLERSKALQDQPMKPIDKAVFWVEYVVRHQGAPHFRSAGIDLKWYQREMIDVFLLFGFIALVQFLAVRYLVRKVVRFFKKVDKLTNKKSNKKVKKS